ncbi:MFS transporter [Sciscionella sediminilitoris]|uniref:MFS transporter n=1 Tax=Sciscionella sediminilitoris TaxID=1445613 RepID=UPI0009EAE111|nr:MFS transporter [Sciscionella sp. SE31]
MLIATINSSIVLIALPDIFKGIGINPLETANTSYLLWMIMGFLVVTAVLVVAFGRLGDMFGRARMYNMGFAIFTVSSVLLAVTWFHGDAAAMWLIGWRIVQGIGGAFLMANSSAIITDAFPANQRGMALGINGVAAIAGSFLGLVIGGVLAPVNWHLVFIVSVPIGVLGTVWAYLKLHDLGERKHAGMDWWGNLTFAIGLIAVLVGITYGIQPYGGHPMGWTSPMVLGCIIGGVAVLAVFAVIETRVAEPLFNLRLFRIRAFLTGNLANLMASLSRGGLQFILIIWLQGIWLPQHGYSFESTPLWAGIYMLPMTVGFLVAAPISGVLSDRFGARAFAAVGIFVVAVSFLLLILLPANFPYWPFAAILVVNGLGMGLFTSPNRAAVMNSLPVSARGVGAGMTATFQNAAMVLSIGIFFSLIITGLAAHLPSAMASGLAANGVPQASAHQVADLPAVAVLFAAFLGYNPIQQLLGPVLHGLPPDKASYLTGRSFFPQLITEPFSSGLHIAFVFAIIACLIAAVASVLCGPARAGVGGEAARARIDGGSGGIGTPGGNGVHGSGQQRQRGKRGAAEAVVSAGAFAPRPPGSVPVHGTVQRDGGEPVPGAVVTLIDTAGRQVGRASTGPDGGYRLAAPSAGRYVLIVSADAHQPEASSITVGGNPLEMDLLLTGTAELLGAVTSAASGEPIIGATATLADARGEVVGAESTDERGAYAFDRLLAGEYTLVVSAEAFRPFAMSVRVAGSGRTRQDVALNGGLRLSGIARTGPDGHPVGDARITLLDADGRVLACTDTGSDGSYRFADLAEGEYTVIASGYPPVTSSLTLDGGASGRYDVILGHPETNR